jgi:hypothetical protein
MRKLFIFLWFVACLANPTYAQYTGSDAEVDRIFTETILEYRSTPDGCDVKKPGSRKCITGSEDFTIRLVLIKGKKYIRIVNDNHASLFAQINVRQDTTLLMGRPLDLDLLRDKRYLATLNKFTCPKKRYRVDEPWTTDDNPPGIGKNPLVFTKKVTMVYEIDFKEKTITAKPKLLGKMSFDNRKLC